MNNYPTNSVSVSNGNNIVDSKEIKNTLQKVTKNWYWFILFLFLCLGASFAYLYKATNYYGATAKILLKPEKNALQDALSNQLISDKLNSEEIANEMLILSSTKLIDEAVTILNLDISYYIAGKLRTGEVYQKSPYTVDGKILKSNFYGAPFNVNILSDSTFYLKVKGNNGSSEYEEEYKFNEPIVNDDFSIILKNDSGLIATHNSISSVNYQFVINQHDYVVSEYKKALQITKEANASVINVLFSDQVWEKSVDFVSTLVDLYIDNSIAVSKEINTNTLKFIDEQLEEVAAKLNTSESSLEAFQKSKTTLDIGNEQSVYLQRMIDFDSEKAKLSIQLQSIDHIYKNLTANNELAISPALLADQNDPALSSAFTELTALQQRKTNLLFSNTPNSPVVLEVDARISEARKRVISMIMNTRKKLASTINGLTAQVGQYRGAIQQMPSTARGLVDINRKVAINEKIYLFLLETRAETVISKAAIVADKTVLEPATSIGVIRPNKQKIIFAGIGSAIAFFFLLIFFKEIFHNSINNRQELSELTNLPIIGVVPVNKESDENYLVVDKYPQSLTAEAFRVIRTNISYFATKSSTKTILFTSSAAGEGKTFCAINLATILAKAKKKVILIDLDLHKPKQANAFNIKNDIGVTSFLVGKANMDEIIKDTHIQGLQVILTGPRTPNASELIIDPLLEELLKRLKEKYEFVIIDSPPAGLLSDALVLMRQSDINIFVLKANYSKRDFVEVAHHIADKNEIKSMTFLLNSVKSSNIPAGYGGGYYK